MGLPLSGTKCLSTRILATGMPQRMKNQPLSFDIERFPRELARVVPLSSSSILSQPTLHTDNCMVASSTPDAHSTPIRS